MKSDWEWKKCGWVEVGEHGKSVAWGHRCARKTPGRACEDVAIRSGGRLLLPVLLAFLAEQLHHAGVRGVRDLLQHQPFVSLRL